MDLPTTDGSLLLALQSQSPARREAAWEKFEPRYRPVILAWCQRRLPLETARELTQEILLKLSVKFPEHCYDPNLARFRSWLKAVVGNALADYGRRQQRQLDGDAVGGTDHARQLAELVSPEAAEELSEVIASEPATRAAQILAAVQARVPELHWKAFWLYHLEKRSVEEIARELGLSMANVYKILQRIKKLLEEEIAHG
ncbi:MAG: sigma-70 family RNA polymerase sigma factor [Gemmataceae bacterium]|nr:sigma-70 family RNA polymerase sigma factor [Gemmataceae bacterium]